MTTTLYHVVPRDTAIQILAEGFWDAGSPWLPRSSESRGVFLATRPLDANDGLPDDWNTVLEVELPASFDELRMFMYESGPERHWLVPADVVNGVGSTRLLEQNEMSEAEIKEALSRHEDRLRLQGTVGELLEEQMEKFEGYLRRWEPQDDPG